MHYICSSIASMSTFNNSGTSKFNIEKGRFKEMFETVYTLFQKGGTSSSLHFGTYKYSKLQEQSFTDMILCLSSMVNSIRNLYTSTTGHPQKFISVCQDIRDSKRCELIGTSLMIIHPETFEHFKVSAGLVHISGKKATYIVHDTLTVLKRYSSMQEDLFRPVNDTTASAILVGRLIVGCNDPGTCGIH